MNILIVDNDPDDTFLFCEALKSVIPTANCTSIHSCSKLSVAMDKIALPDVVFFDVLMEPMGGMECLILLMNYFKGTHTKIVIHSENLSPKQNETFTDLGGTYVMAKSVNFKTMGQDISDLLIDQFQLT